MKHHPNGSLKNTDGIFHFGELLMRNTRWCSGKSTASHRCDASANSGDDTTSEMSLFLILSLTLSGFSLVTPCFLRPQKPGMVHEEPLCVCGYATSKSLFIFIIIIKSFVVRMLDNFWYWRFRMQMLDSPVQLLVR